MLPSCRCIFRCCLFEGSLAGNLASLLLSQLLGSKLQVNHSAASGSIQSIDSKHAWRVVHAYGLNLQCHFQLCAKNM